jgi:hypothetical protein
MAHAGTEEFSTFSPEAQEEDDESLLDHYLLRMPRAWHDEWERAPQAIRTAQGCLTSGQWFIHTDLKLRAPLGRRARFGLEIRQNETDVVSYQYFDFTFQFPTRFGTPGFLFRPLAEKSLQDFGLTWTAGEDTSTHQLRLAFVLEDMFNNFWEFRQSSMGNRSAPYERRPYEPGLEFVTRHDGWRAEMGGRYLTPSRRRIEDFGTPSLSRITELWGTLAWAAVEARAAGLDWELRGYNHQALSTDRPVVPSPEDHHDFRRSWWVESALGRRLASRLAIEGRWLYQERTQNYGVPIGPGTFDAIDRLLGLEAEWSFTPTLVGRIGALHDQITVAKTGTTPHTTFGSRRESRAYVGLMARFGRVSLQGIEGFELDQEPYDVWFVHDKGFIQLQTTF